MCDSGPSISVPTFDDVKDFARQAINTASLDTINIDREGNTGFGRTTQNLVTAGTLGTIQIDRRGNTSDGFVTRGVHDAGQWIEHAANDAGNWTERMVRQGGEAISGAATRRQMQESADAALKQAKDDRTKTINDANYRAMIQDRQASNFAKSGKGRQTLGTQGSLQSTTYLGL